MTITEKILHDIELKLLRTTTYSSNPLTLRKLLFHIYLNLLYPFKKRGFFGYCDECGKFRRNLESQVIDVDYCDDDPDGPVVLPVRGMVCEECYFRIDDRRWNI